MRITTKTTKKREKRNQKIKKTILEMDPETTASVHRVEKSHVAIGTNATELTASLSTLKKSKLEMV